MSEDVFRTIQDLPAPQACRLVEFDTAQVVTLRIVPPRHVLTVTGVKPTLNMVVVLTPRMYIRQPEYWGIEVVGWQPGIFLPAEAPYVAQLDLDGIVGTRGIEVIGANKSERTDLAGAGINSLELSITGSSSGKRIASATLTCPPDDSAHPHAQEACEQLIEANGYIEAIPESPQWICPAVFDPVIVAASGTWNGEPRHYRQEFSNQCVAIESTGGTVFRLSRDA